MKNSQQYQKYFQIIYLQNRKPKDLVQRPQSNYIPDNAFVNWEAIVIKAVGV